MPAVYGKGNNEFKQLARQLQDLADGALIEEASKAINRATKGVKAEIKMNALATLPRRGGANAWVAAAPIKTLFRIRKTGKREVGVFIVQRKKRHDLLAVNRGRLRHPLPNNRDKWFTTAVEPGYFDKPIERKAPEIERRIASALLALIQRGTRKAA